MASRRVSTAPGGRRQSVSATLMKNLNLNLNVADDLNNAQATGHSAAAAADAEAPREDEQQRRERMQRTPTIVVPKYSQAVWTDDEDLVDLRHNVSDSFRALWSTGMAAYIRGDWQKARDVFHETMRLFQDRDGPSRFLMAVIDENGGRAPHDWCGYRDESQSH